MESEYGYSINKVILAGKIGTVPQLQKLSNGTPLCYFSLSVIEKWTSPDGQPMERNNWFKIEVLGKNAEYVFDTVKKNQWFLIDGYLRYEKYDEEKSIVKVRAFSISPLNPTIMGVTNETVGKTKESRKQNTGNVCDGKPRICAEIPV